MFKNRSIFKRILSCIAVLSGRQKRSYESQRLEKYVLIPVSRDEDIVNQGGQFQARKSHPPWLLQSFLQNNAHIYQKQFNGDDRVDLMSRLKNQLG